MQPAQDGIFKRCRGFAALLVALSGTFAAASRHDDTSPGGAAISADNGGNVDELVVLHFDLAGMSGMAT